MQRRRRAREQHFDRRDGAARLPGVSSPGSNSLSDSGAARTTSAGRGRSGPSGSRPPRRGALNPGPGRNASARGAADPASSRAGAPTPRRSAWQRVRRRDHAVIGPRVAIGRQQSPRALGRRSAAGPFAADRAASETDGPSWLNAMVVDEAPDLGGCQSSGIRVRGIDQDVVFLIDDDGRDREQRGPSRGQPSRP